MPKLLARLKAMFVSPPAQAPVALSDRERALALVRAVDAGGIPLNPARVNEIARSLGLEVSRTASVDDTVRRIRTAVERLPP